MDEKSKVALMVHQAIDKAGNSTNLARILRVRPNTVLDWRRGAIPGVANSQKIKDYLKRVKS